MDFKDRMRRAQTPGPGAFSSRESSVEKSQPDVEPSSEEEQEHNASVDGSDGRPESEDLVLSNSEAESSSAVEDQVLQLAMAVSQQNFYSQQEGSARRPEQQPVVDSAHEGDSVAMAVAGLGKPEGGEGNGQDVAAKEDAYMENSAVLDKNKHPESIPETNAKETENELAKSSAVSQSQEQSAGSEEPMLDIADQNKNSGSVPQEQTTPHPKRQEATADAENAEEPASQQAAPPQKDVFFADDTYSFTDDAADVQRLTGAIDQQEKTIEKTVSVGAQGRAATKAVSQCVAVPKDTADTQSSAERTQKTHVLEKPASRVEPVTEAEAPRVEVSTGKDTTGIQTEPSEQQGIIVENVGKNGSQPAKSSEEQQPTLVEATDDALHSSACNDIQILHKQSEQDVAMEDAARDEPKHLDTQPSTEPSGQQGTNSENADRHGAQPTSAKDSQSQEQQPTLIEGERDDALHSAAYNGVNHQEPREDVVMEDALRDEHGAVAEQNQRAQGDGESETSPDDTTPKDPLQPCLVKECDKAALQPSLAPEEVAGIAALQAATHGREGTLQPSIDPTELLKGGRDPTGKVQTWLHNTQDGPSDSDEQAAISVEAHDNEPLMSAVDLQNLQQYLRDHNRDTPDPDDESILTDQEAVEALEEYAAHEPSLTPSDSPSPPRNRIVESVRTGSRRPGSKTCKRKRGNSSAGRRAKSRSMSREIKEEQPAIKIELPDRCEFELTKTQRLGSHNYLWGVKPPTPELDTTNLTNLGVRAVNPLDDDEDGPTQYRGTGGTTVHVPSRLRESLSVDTPPPKRTQQRPRPRTPRAPRRMPTPLEVDEGEDADVEEIEEVPEDVPEQEAPPKKPACFDDLPAEIQCKIFRGLLLSDVQIYVYEGWSKVYPISRHRNKFNIEPAILAVCKRAYYVGTRVLYGENTFVYSLRDALGPTAKPPADVDQLAQDDSSTQVSDQDDESEYQDDDVDMDADDDHVISRRHRRPMPKDWEGDIRIAKYFPLFRRIIIEAEHNRYGDETMRSMADAVDFWKDPPLSATQPLMPVEEPREIAKADLGKTRASKDVEVKPPKPQKSNLRTLSLRIFPSWKSSEHSPNDGYYTFVSFFASASPVIASLKTTLPQFTRLEMVWKHLHSRARPSCLIVDMRPLRIRRNVAEGGRDIWHGDMLMLNARFEGVKKAIKALSKLEESVQSHCEKQSNHQVEDGEDLFEEEWSGSGETGEFIE